MTFIVFLRFLSDTGFYFFFAGTVSGFFGAQPRSVALGLALQCLAATAGYLLRGKSLRFAPLAVPALYIVLFAQGIVERLALVLPLIYIFRVLQWESFEPTWEHEADLFSKFWKIVLFVLFLWASFSGLFGGGMELLTGAVLPGAAVTMTSLILLTRALRHDRDVYVRSRRQLVDLTIFALLIVMSAILSSQPVLDGALYLAKTLFLQLIWPVLKLALWLVSQVIRFTGYLISLIYHEGADTEMPDLQQEMGSGGETAIPDLVEPAEGSPVLRTVLILIGAAALVYLAYRLLKILYLRGPALADNGEREIQRDTIIETVEPPPRTRARTPVERIRREYRRYLKLCGQRGIALRPRDTSLSVERRSREFSAPDASGRLRELYVAARYDGAGDKAAAEQAEESLRQLRKEWRDSTPADGGP